MAQILDLGKIRFQYRGAYDPAVQYEFNDCVRFNGHVYAHTSGTKTTGTSPTNNGFWTMMSPGFAFQSTWDSSTQYGPGSVVRYGGNLYYYSAATESTGNLPTNATYWTVLMAGWNYTGNWSSGTAYHIGELVSYGGIVYVASQDSTGQNPNTSGSYWSTVAPGFQFEGTYNGGTTYQKDDIVTYGGNSYVATTTTTGNLPTNTSYWSLFVAGQFYAGTWSAGTNYLIGQVVVNTAGSAYIALQDSPAGTAVTNTSYWGPLGASLNNTIPLQVAGTLSLSSTDATLSTSADGSSFASLVRITAAREFASVTLPSASGANLSTTKYKVVNESQYAVALRDNTGQLLTSILANGFVELALVNNASQAGVWHLTGRDLMPVFVRNSVLVPSADATAANNSATTNPIFDTRLDSNKVLSVHTTANATISCFVTDYSTIPATVTPNPTVFTPSNTTIIGVFTISATRAIVFTLTDAYLIGINGVTTSLVASSASAYTSPVRTGVMGVIGVQQMDTDLFVSVYDGGANGQPVITPIKYDADVIRFTNFAATLGSTVAVANGYDFAVTSTSSLVFVSCGYSYAGTAGTAPYDLMVGKFTITKNASGVAPTVTQVQSLQVEPGTRYYNGAAYTINVVPDSTNKDTCLITAYATTTWVRAIAVTGCTGGSANLAAGASVQVDTQAPGTYTANTMGQTYTRRILKSVAAGKWHVAYLGASSYPRMFKLNVSGTTTTLKVANSTAKNGAGSAVSLLPFFTNAADSEFFVTQGQPNGAQSGIAGFSEDVSEVPYYRSFQAPGGDHLHTLVGAPILCTSDGWVLVQIAQPNTATTVVVLNNMYAVFRCYSGGQVKYWGQFALPYNSSAGTVYNPQFVEAGRIVHAHVANDYDYTNAIPYRRASYIEFAKV